MINAKLQNIIDTKSAIGNAIVNKGGTITGETPFFNYAAQIDGISTGTPQTIFAASDGSKWALTNAVNLVNDAGNVTSDFNYWQPANNSTSDPILNIGTVGANISGNIRVVPVNQVNIAQYVNIVINDTTGAKYVGYNGYDSQTNPTPTGNTTFNRWLLNNSASGTIIFANTTITNGGTFNGPNTIANITNLALINNTASYGGTVRAVFTNNGFIYAAGVTNQRIQKFNESDLARASGTNVSNDFGGTIFAITVNNGFIYAGGFVNRIQKFYESNLALVGNTGDTGSFVLTMKTNNGFLYAGGSNGVVGKYYESNLGFVGNTAAFGGAVRAITTNNSFIYAGGSNNEKVEKYYESNLASAGNTPNYGSTIFAITTNNGFIYAGGQTNQRIQKFNESDLARASGTNVSNDYGGTIFAITTNNGFIYAGGQTNQTIQKFYESNLGFVNNTANYGGQIQTVKTNNGFIYVAGDTNETIKKFQEQGLSQESLTFYTATKIKE
jgi:hypothetical protein